MQSIIWKAFWYRKVKKCKKTTTKKQLISIMIHFQSDIYVKKKNKKKTKYDAINLSNKILLYGA